MNLTLKCYQKVKTIQMKNATNWIFIDYGSAVLLKSFFFYFFFFDLQRSVNNIWPHFGLSFERSVKENQLSGGLLSSQTIRANWTVLSPQIQ